MCTTTSDNTKCAASGAGISSADFKLYQSLLSQGVDASDMTFAKPGIKVSLYETEWNALQLENEVGNTYSHFVKDVTLYAQDPTDRSYKAVKCDHRITEIALNYGINKKWTDARPAALGNNNNANAILILGVPSLDSVDVPIAAVTQGTVITAGSLKKLAATIVSPGDSSPSPMECSAICKASYPHAYQNCLNSCLNN